MPEKVSPDVLEERIKSVDEKYGRMLGNVEKDIQDLEGKVDGQTNAFNQLKLDLIDEMSDIRLAQEQGERRVMTDIEKARVSRNRWIIGTAFASVIGVLGLIVDILKG